MRYTGPSCRQCRREGTKLFLKGTKCFTEKCPVERRPYAPGQHIAESDAAGQPHRLGHCRAAHVAVHENDVHAFPSTVVGAAVTAGATHVARIPVAAHAARGGQRFGARQINSHRGAATGRADDLHMAAGLFDESIHHAESEARAVVLTRRRGIHLREFAEDQIVMLGGNPVFTAPADLFFASKLDRSASFDRLYTSGLPPGRRASSMVFTGMSVRTIRI